MGRCGICTSVSRWSYLHKEERRLSVLAEGMLISASTGLL